MSNNMTWHCKLILVNDEECTEVVDCFTTHVMSRVYHDWRGEAYPNQRNARISVLSEFIKAYVEEITDAGNERNLHSPMAQELIWGALQEVDWREIAEDMIGDYSPKSPAEIADNEEYFNIMGFGDYDIDED